MKKTLLTICVKPLLALIIFSLSSLFTDASPMLEEVLVTAQKREQSLQDVPITLSAFSGEQLEKFGVDGMQTLQSITPGLVFSNTGAIAQPYLRGVGTRASINGLEPSIATYIDGRYVARSSATLFDFADVARVEVLKGPQGTLYGRNATGGAIRIVTKGVDQEFGGKVTASLGNYSQRSLSATLSGPVTDTFGVRFTLLNNQRDGYADNLVEGAIDTFDDQDFEAYRTKFAWDISDIWSTTLSLAYWQRDDTAGSDQVDLSPPGLNVGVALGGYSGQSRDEVATAIAEKNRGEEYSAEFNIKASFDGFDIVAMSTYSEYEQQSAVDGDGTSTRIVDAYFDESETAFSQEIQILSNNPGRFEWLLGAYYYDGNAQFDGALDAGTPTKLSQSLQTLGTIAWAVFGQSTFRFNEAWALTLGGRWSVEEKDVDAQASKDNQVTIVDVPYSNSEEWGEFTPKISLEYSLEESLIYLSYARGFKSGGFNYPASGSPVLDPEILDMLELGLKSDLLDRRFRLNMSMYYYDYYGLQVTRSAGSNTTPTTENAADSTVLGLDVDLTWLLSDNASVVAGTNFLETEYKDYDANAKQFNANVIGLPVAPGMSDTPYDASGESLLRAPDWSAFASLNYTAVFSKASLPISLTYSYKDEYDFDFIADANSMPLRQKAYGVLNANISYLPNTQGWSVFVWANNLTDEEYFDDVVANVAGLRGSWAAPRTYGIKLSYEL